MTPRSSFSSLSGCSAAWFNASALGAEDRGFESRHPDHEIISLDFIEAFLWEFKVVYLFENLLDDCINKSINKSRSIFDSL